MNNTSAEGLQRTWNQIAPGSGVYVVSHSDGISWRISLSSNGNPEAGLETNNKFSFRLNLENISSETRLLNSGMFYEVIVLKDRQYFSVFSAMIADLISASERAANEKDAEKKIKRQFRSWEKLFSKQRVRFSDNELRGLAGELLELLRLLEASPAEVARSVVEGWIGPIGADQDFSYETFWEEVKTTAKDSDQVTISSLQQLDRNDPGVLAVYFLETCSSVENERFTISEIIEKIRKILADDFDADSMFFERLKDFGIPDYHSYDDKYFKMHGYRRYTVNDRFPRLTRKNVPVKVNTCTYSLLLAALQEWKEEGSVC